MTLNAFMQALKTEGVKVTLLDSDGKEIIKFYSDGYAGVEADILARTIKKFEIPANNSLNITLNDAVTTDTTDTTNNG